MQEYNAFGFQKFLCFILFVFCFAQSMVIDSVRPIIIDCAIDVLQHLVLDLSAYAFTSSDRSVVSLVHIFEKSVEVESRVVCRYHPCLA